MLKVSSTSGLNNSDRDDYNGDDSMIIDSGANKYAFVTAEYLNSISRLRKPKYFIPANNQRTLCRLSGDVLWLKDVLYDYQCT